MWNRQIQRVAEQCRDRKPVGETADQRRFEKRDDDTERRTGLDEDAGHDEQDRHRREQAAGEPLRPAQPQPQLFVGGDHFHAAAISS